MTRRGNLMAVLMAAAALAPTGPYRPTGRGTARVPHTPDLPRDDATHIARAEAKRRRKAAKRAATAPEGS